MGDIGCGRLAVQRRMDSRAVIRAWALSFALATGESEIPVSGPAVCRHRVVVHPASDIMHAAGRTIHFDFISII